MGTKKNISSIWNVDNIKIHWSTFSGYNLTYNSDGSVTIRIPGINGGTFRVPSSIFGGSLSNTDATASTGENASPQNVYDYVSEEEEQEEDAKVFNSNFVPSTAFSAQNLPVYNNFDEFQHSETYKPNNNKNSSNNRVSSSKKPAKNRPDAGATINPSVLYLPALQYIDNNIPLKMDTQSNPIFTPNQIQLNYLADYFNYLNQIQNYQNQPSFNGARQYNVFPPRYVQPDGQFNQFNPYISSQNSYGLPNFHLGNPNYKNSLVNPYSPFVSYNPMFSFNGNVQMQSLANPSNLYYATNPNNLNAKDDFTDEEASTEKQ